MNYLPSEFKNILQAKVDHQDLINFVKLLANIDWVKKKKLYYILVFSFSSFSMCFDSYLFLYLDPIL